MNKLRKLLAASTIFAMTIALAPAGFASAAVAQDGDLIKMNGLSSVYYLKGGKRYVFPNFTTYNSWYADFNGVKTVPQAELEGYMLGGNVTMRPGTKLVKVTTNPTVYAVEPNGTLRAIASEDQAKDLYGTNWNKMIVDVPDAFFTNYTIGATLPAGQYPVGQVVNPQGTQDLYYWDGSNYRKFSNESALLANGMRFDYVVTTSKTITANGTAITAAEAVLTDVAQGAKAGQVVYTGGSGLTVAADAKTPAAANIPQGATQVPFFSFNVTASNDGAITLKNVAVTRYGIGSYNNFNNVYLYDGNTRLTTGRSVNSSTNKVNFTGVNYAVPAGQTKTLTVKADIAATGNNNYFAIASASDIDAGGATVSGTFPMNGNTMTIVAQDVGTATIERTGSNTNQPKAGDSAFKIAEFTVNASGSEDVTVNAINLYNSGTLSSDKISNFVLKQAGNTVATVASMTNSQIPFVLTSPIALDKGTTKTFEVYADISTSARQGDTVVIYMDNDADLLAVGKTYGFGTKVTRNYDGSNATKMTTNTVQAGQLTFSFTGPSVQDYATQGSDVELMRFKVTSQSNIEVRHTHLALTGTSALKPAGANAHYTDVKFVDVATGGVIIGPLDVTDNATTQILNFNDTWNLNAGQTREIKVTADVANFTPAGAETIKAVLNSFAASDIKNLDTNTFLSPTSDIVPSGAITGNTHNIKTANVTLTKAGVPATQSYINGKQGADVLGLNISAGQGKDVKVTSLTLTATGTGVDGTPAGSTGCTTETNCILTVKLYDGTTQVGDAKSLASNNTVTFNNLSYVVPKGTTKTLVAKADFNNLGSVATNSSITFGVASTGDISVQDMDGNSVSNSSTVAGNTMSIIGNGSATIAAGATVTNETDTRLVAAGSNDVVLARFRVNATNEDLQLTKVRVQVAANANNGAASAADTEVAGLALYDGSTKIADYASPSALGTVAYADFTLADGKFVVSKDNYKELTVKANLNTISGGARTNTKLSTSIDYNDNLQIRGVNGSNTNISALSPAADVTANNNIYVMKSIPTVTLATLPSTTLVNGEVTIAKFTVTADAKGAVDWTKMAFTAATNGIDNLTTARLVDDSGNTVAGTSAAIAGSGATTTVTISSTQDQLIGAGSSKTYSLKTTVSGLVANTGGSISTIFKGSDAYAATGAAGMAGNFVWSDESATGHAYGTTTDYMNSSFVKGLPSDPQTLSK